MTTEANLAATYAVIPNAIPLHDVALIGIFSGPDQTKAMLRGARGAITFVVVGDTIADLTITAIDDSGVMATSEGGAATRLTMP